MEFNIQEYSDLDYDAFKEMLFTCINIDYKMQRTMEQVERWQRELIQQAAERIVFLDILKIENTARGFIIYQIDSPKSDWCEKEGYGFIRELYVAEDFRKSGCGRVLVTHAEKQLNQKSVPGIYLTTDEAMDFWTKMGYSDSGEICLKNDCRIFVK